MLKDRFLPRDSLCTIKWVGRSFNKVSSRSATLNKSSRALLLHPFHFGGDNSETIMLHSFILGHYFIIWHGYYKLIQATIALSKLTLQILRFLRLLSSDDHSSSISASKLHLLLPFEWTGCSSYRVRDVIKGLTRELLT